MQELINRYFAAMRLGATAEDEMLSLFADDATYIEPFSGDDEPAVGIDAIRARFRRGWQTPLPDMELEVLGIEVAGASATSTWECRSPIFPGPVRGTDSYEFVDGRIARLEVRIDER